MTNVRRFGPLVRTDGGLLIPANAGTGKVLTSDAEGNATWQAINWVNVEAVNANMSQTTLIQIALFNGIVYMRGLGKVSTEITAKSSLFTVPSAMRPIAARNLQYNTTTGTATANLQIKTNGEAETSILLAANKTPAFDLVYPL